MNTSTTGKRNASTCVVLSINDKQNNFLFNVRRKCYDNHKSYDLM